MAYWKHLKLDDETRKALEVRDREARKKKLYLSLFLVIMLLVSYLLKMHNWLTQNTFELIFVAFIGGFIGSALSYIIKGND